MNRNKLQRKHSRHFRRQANFDVVNLTVQSQRDGRMVLKDAKGFTYRMPHRGPSRTYYNTQYCAPRFEVDEHIEGWDREILNEGRRVVALVSPAFVGNGYRRVVAYTTHELWRQASLK